MTFTKGHTLWNHPNCKKSQFKHGEARHSVPHSVEAKLKMSESRKGKAVGSANPSWKGGVTPLLIKLKRLTEYKTWQKGVFARDNYTCRSCSIRGCKTLTAHHLVSFSFIVQMFKVRSVYEAREQIMLWNIRNGVTLCEECHKQTANYAWRANKKPRDRAMYKIALLFVIFLIPAFSQAATFGYTTIGASSDNTQNMRGSGFNLPVTADLVSITYGSEFTGSVERAGALYSSTSPATYTSGSATNRQSAGSDVRGFYTLYASTTPTISAGNYVIVVKSNTSSFFRPYDSVAGVFYIDEASTIVYNGWDASEANVNWGRKFSQYATYAITTATTTTGGAKVRKTTATIYGSIVNTTDSPIFNHGFAYSLNSDLETGVSTTSIGTTTLSNFSLDLSGLQEMSTYYYRAFSVNAIGTSTGSILSFTTTAQKTIRLNNGTIRINNGTLDL